MTKRILMYNWHEGYIHMMARTGREFDVVEVPKAGVFGWIRAFRPVPDNCRLISAEEAGERGPAGDYHCVVAHNLEDLLLVREWPLPKILVFHNKLSTQIAMHPTPVVKAAYREDVSQLFRATRDLTLVFISQSKMMDWGLAGEIVLPGVHLADYGGYTGILPGVVRVGNGMLEREILFGYNLQEQVLRGIRSTILGLNPRIPDSFVPEDWESFKDHLRENRVYLNTTQHPYEDGYNIALLEAMATGMPVVSLANPTSPIEDGVNGFISADPKQLTEQIRVLLADHDLAIELGRRARETVRDLFPMQNFVDRWNRLLDCRPQHFVGRVAIRDAGPETGQPPLRNHLFLPDTRPAFQPPDQCFPPAAVAAHGEEAMTAAARLLGNLRAGRASCCEREDANTAAGDLLGDLTIGRAPGCEREDANTAAADLLGDLRAGRAPDCAGEEVDAAAVRLLGDLMIGCATDCAREDAMTAAGGLPDVPRNPEAAFFRYAALAEGHTEEPGHVLRLLDLAAGGPQVEQASRLLNLSLAMHPANRDLLLHGARFLREHGQPRKAVECLERVLLFYPDCLEASAGLRDLMIGQAISENPCEVSNGTHPGLAVGAHG